MSNNKSKGYKNAVKFNKRKYSTNGYNLSKLSENTPANNTTSTNHLEQVDNFTSNDTIITTASVNKNSLEDEFFDNFEDKPTERRRNRFCRFIESSSWDYYLCNNP